MRVGLKDTPERVCILGDGHTPLKISDREKDIGVIIDCTLNFEHHVAVKINMENSILGMIHNIFQYNYERTMVHTARPTLRVCKPSLVYKLRICLYTLRLWKMHNKKK